jgi:preprotein translocase subunit SecE
MSAQRRSSAVNRRARGAAARRGTTTTIEAPGGDGVVSATTEPTTTAPATPAPKMATRADAAPARRSRLDGIRRYLNDTRAELRRVTWPDQITVRNLTGVVIAVSAVMGVLLGGIDFVLLRLFEAL